MPQNWLYDPITNLQTMFAELATFQELMGAADASEALDHCKFLGTNWDANGEEIPVLPGAIFGMLSGLTRRRGTASNFRTQGISLWVILQATVPAESKTDFETEAKWFCGKLQSILNELETLTLGYQHLDITSYEVTEFPERARAELDRNATDYWWTLLQVEVGN